MRKVSPPRQAPHAFASLYRQTGLPFSISQCGFFGAGAPKGRSDRAEAELPGAPAGAVGARAGAGVGLGAGSLGGGGAWTTGAGAPPVRSLRASRRDHDLASAHATGLHFAAPEFFSRAEPVARGYDRPARRPRASVSPDECRWRAQAGGRRTGATGAGAPVGGGKGLAGAAPEGVGFAG